MATNKFPKFLSSVTLLDGTVLKNRVGFSPLTRARCADEVPRQHNIDYYVQRANAGIIVTEGTFISDGAKGWAHVPGIYKPEHVEGWKKVTDAVHIAEGVIYCQLWHMGRVSHSSYGKHPVAPSAVVANGDGVYGADFQKHPYEVPHALSTDEIKTVIEEYKHAAKCALEAG